MQIHYGLYFGSLVAIHLIYALVYVGIISTVPQYVYLWNIWVQIGLCLFLMYQYHPFRKQYTMGGFDAKMIFGASTILLVNIIVLGDKIHSPIHVLQQKLASA